MSYVSGRKSVLLSCLFFLMIRPPPRSTLFPTRRSSDLHVGCGRRVTAPLRPVRLRPQPARRSEEHTSELQSHHDLVCRLLLEKKKDAKVPFRCTSITATNSGSIMLTSTRSRIMPAVLTIMSSPPNVSIFLSIMRFFFNDTATTAIYTLSLHAALPI